MPKHEPKVVDAVISKGHGDYRRGIVEPEACPIDLRRRQRFVYYIPDATFSENPRDFPGLLSGTEQCIEFRQRRPNSPWRITGDHHLACDLPDPVQPS